MENDYKELNLSKNGVGITTITINRSPFLNALNRAVFYELNLALSDIAQDDETIIVVITGSGNKAFVAGADITEFRSIPPAQAKSFLSFGNQVMEKIEQFPKLVIAAINGFALGGGLELAMACHLRIAVETARFGMPEINLGILPGYGGTQRLPKLIGKANAIEMILSGNMIDANTAFQYGLIHKIYPQDIFYNSIDEYARPFLSKPPISIKNIIKVLNADLNFEDGLSVEGDLFTNCTLSEDFQEGVSAFLEKRKPIFKGV